MILHRPVLKFLQECGYWLWRGSLAFYLAAGLVSWQPFCYIPSMRSFPVTVFMALALDSLLLHADHEIVPCNCFLLVALVLYATLNEPLAGVDSFEVLLDGPILIFIPVLPWISTPICRSLFYEIGQVSSKINISTCRSGQADHVRTSRRSRLLRRSFRLGRFCAWSASWISASIRRSLFYEFGQVSSKINMSTCRSGQARFFFSQHLSVLLLSSTPFIFWRLMLLYIFLFYISFSFRNAYRAEVATFVVPVAGESASDTRLRERIDFTSNILFFIEDLFLALGPGLVRRSMSPLLCYGCETSWLAGSRNWWSPRKLGGRSSVTSRTRYTYKSFKLKVFPLPTTAISHWKYQFSSNHWS